MIPSQMVHDCLQRAFAPTQRGIAGLTEQLLAACVGGDVEFERVEDRCVCRWIVGGDIQEATVPLPPAAFRTILARIAVLCNERSPNSATPYGGEGLLAPKGSPSTVLKVAFVNTPNKQQMKLRSLDAEALDAVEKKPTLEGQTQEIARAPAPGVGALNGANNWYDFPALQRPIPWAPATLRKPRIVFEAMVGTEQWAVRMNDFPDEPLYTLLIGDTPVIHFDDWPAFWFPHPPFPKIESAASQ